jgi:hypothetical protein
VTRLWVEAEPPTDDAHDSARPPLWCGCAAVGCGCSRETGEGPGRQRLRRQIRPARHVHAISWLAKLHIPPSHLRMMARASLDEATGSSRSPTRGDATTPRCVESVYSEQRRAGIAGSRAPPLPC